MICLDANIVIESFKSSQVHLTDMLDEKRNELACSEIVRLEVLGYHKLKPAEVKILEQFFKNIILIPIDKTIISKAISLRRQKPISIGDAIIAATALINNQVLWTNNNKDFHWINDLKWHNPLTNSRADC